MSKKVELSVGEKVERLLSKGYAVSLTQAGLSGFCSVAFSNDRFKSYCGCDMFEALDRAIEDIFGGKE